MDRALRRLSQSKIMAAQEGGTVRALVFRGVGFKEVSMHKMWTAGTEQNAYPEGVKGPRITNTVQGISGERWGVRST